MSRESTFWHDYVPQHPGHAVFTFDPSHAVGAAVCLFLRGGSGALPVRARAHAPGLIHRIGDLAVARRDALEARLGVR